MDVAACRRFAWSPAPCRCSAAGCAADGEALAVGAQAGQQAGRQHRAGARAGWRRSRGPGWLREGRGDLLVKLVDGLLRPVWSWRQISCTRRTKLSITAVSSVTGTALATSARRWSMSFWLRRAVEVVELL